MMEVDDHERTMKVLRELAMSLQILQRRVDDLDTRLKALEQDRAERPGWGIDEGD